MSPHLLSYLSSAKLPFPSLRWANASQSLCACCASQARTPARLRGRDRSDRPRTSSSYSRVSAARPAHEPGRSQAQPLGGFYEDLLATPLPPRGAPPPPPQPPQPQPTEEPRPPGSGPKIFYGAERKYRGGISERPDSTWQTVNGVPIPPRPAEPDNCCMSGCVHCVWDDYRDEVENWAERLRQAQAKAHRMAGMDGPTVAESPRPDVAEASASVDDDGGGSEALWDRASAVAAPPPPSLEEDLFRDIPVGIREFMATEKRLRDRKKKRKSVLERDDD